MVPPSTTHAKTDLNVPTPELADEVTKVPSILTVMLAEDEQLPIVAVAVYTEVIEGAAYAVGPLVYIVVAPASAYSPEVGDQFKVPLIV
jgi:hypothetical protein